MMVIFIGAERRRWAGARYLYSEIIVEELDDQLL
jgi:hypothetical protein